jgi:hypothetical protein
MKYLKTISDEDIFENLEFEKTEIFEKRTTVKAVVINDDGKFGFITNPVHRFYLKANNVLNKQVEKEILDSIIQLLTSQEIIYFSVNI